MPQLLPRFPAAGPAARTLCILACLLALPALGAEAAESGASLKDAWVRMIIPARPAAGYFTLSNDGSAPLALVSASSPGCGMLMLHKSVSQGGVEEMQMVASIFVPAHGSVAFAPGAYHLMCMSPAATLKVGTTIPVTLNFADGGALTQSFPVRGATGK
jgi:copper(I)-binding protein